jgi:cytochrome c553
MSAVTDRLSEDDLRELARIVRGIHARAAAKRERLERERQEAEARAADGGHDGAA